MKPGADSSGTPPAPRWILLPAALAAVYVLWQAAGELMLARESFQVVFNPLEQALRGDPSAAARFLSRWGLTALELLLFAGLLGLGLLVGLAIAIPSSFSHRVLTAICKIRDRLGLWAVVASLLAAFYPAFFLLYTYWGDVFSGPYLRLVILLAAGLVTGLLLPQSGHPALSSRSFLLGIALVGSLHLICGQLRTVTSYPFSLTWSEGNRLYEYSIPFSADQYKYDGELSAIRRSTGRLWLWGLPFLIPNTPIGVHRLWNALLSTLPHLTLGWLLVRRSSLTPTGKLLFGLWAFLFLAQGPIYTPLILAAILVVVVVRPGKPVRSALAAAAAGYYASLSRWIWLPAIPAWTAILLLEGFETDRYRWKEILAPAHLRKLVPIAIAAAAGLAGGLLANPKLFQPTKLSQSTALSQPLLWYRLFPNATYPEGVLAALALACTPAIILLVWAAATRRWALHPLQILAYLAAGAVFLGGGLVASVKIGGGNNLHNLDMFLITLVILVGLALHRTRIEVLPATVRLVLALAMILPAWTAVRSGVPLKLPQADSTRKALESIRSLAAEADLAGEVLFMDQRQLLTFGNVHGVALVPEYEKKYMMDQAMAGDAEYFAGFYNDLANHRFALIVSDMQFNLQKDSTYAFGEENNAWVEWVSRPLLCYYQPLRTMQNVDIQLLVPNPEAQNCPIP